MVLIADAFITGAEFPERSCCTAAGLMQDMRPSDVALRLENEALDLTRRSLRGCLSTSLLFLSSLQRPSFHESEHLKYGVWYASSDVCVR
jgi:hypothetical protein